MHFSSVAFYHVGRVSGSDVWSRELVVHAAVRLSVGDAGSEVRGQGKRWRHARLRTTRLLDAQSSEPTQMLPELLNYSTVGEREIFYRTRGYDYELKIQQYRRIYF